MNSGGAPQYQDRKQESVKIFIHDIPGLTALLAV
jgi:hypothetical protein